ncbi:hypothetical protein CK203_111170 [Vitis vinifera]|uniref:Uncharacterized protein n=1 Tax=Vitis vinifera TaxID=29760 RepID=A0A438BLV2_VITVI|nr:hypothetical protein CK203_111170 [Vitis vinifera]
MRFNTKNQISLGQLRWKLNLDISLENVSRMHELSEAFHAISLRHTCLLSILEQFSKLSSRAGYVMLSLSLSLKSIYICHFY